MLITLIVIVIIVFGGMYYFKITSNDEQGSYAFRPEVNKIEDKNDVQQVVHTDSTNNTKNESQNQVQIVIPSGGSNSIYTQSPSATTQSYYKYNNRYYYNQLDEYSKAIYDAIEKNLNQFKDGTCKVNIDYDFSNILKNNNSENSLKPYYNDALDALNLDIPNLFYIDFTKLWLYVETKTSLFSTKYNIYLSTKDNVSLYRDGFSNIEDINTAMTQIDTVKNTFTNKAYQNDYYKVREVHDWLIQNLEYDDSDTYISSVYGALVRQKALCEGYARAYKYILDELGINNLLVTGTATNSNGNNENHMWNYVLLDNKWYAIDVTWDDPIIIGGGILSNAAKHRYFLLGSSKFFENHYANNVISSNGKQFEIPILEVGDY